VHRAQHRRDPGRAAGVGAVRPRSRLVHRRQQAPCRALRAGRWRHAAPGRDRRHAAAAAGPPAARAGRRRVLPRRRARAEPRRREPDRRLLPDARAPDAGGLLPLRSLAPARRGAPAIAAVARAARGRAAAGAALPADGGAPPRHTGQAPGRRRDRTPACAPLAGNVRELENACWRLAALAPDDRIGAAEIEALAGLSARRGASTGEDVDVDWEAALAEWARARLAADAQDLHGDARDRMERVLFDAALEFTGGHRGDAAARLGLGRNTLTRRLGKKKGDGGNGGN